MKHTLVPRRTIAAIAASVLILAACGSDTDTDTGDGGSDGAQCDARIVSLSPTATEMLYAIDAGACVVAVDSLSNHPAEAADKLTDISAYEPSAEAILGYDPTHVLISYDPGIVDQLTAADPGIVVWTGDAATSLEGVYAQITELGEVTGRTSEAEELIASMKERIAAATDGVTAPAGTSIFYELDDTLYSVTSSTFVGSLMAPFGVTNIADGVEAGNDYPQLSAEAIIAANPTVIFLADTKCCGQSAATVAARPGWSGIAAVANGNVVELDDDIASRWGPRVVELVEQFAAAIKALSD
jgi:iron complex transport system substrate-binding protein